MCPFTGTQWTCNTRSKNQSDADPSTPTELLSIWHGDNLNPSSSLRTPTSTPPWLPNGGSPTHPHDQPGSQQVCPHESRWLRSSWLDPIIIISRLGSLWLKSFTCHGSYRLKSTFWHGSLWFKSIKWLGPPAWPPRGATSPPGWFISPWVWQWWWWQEERRAAGKLKDTSHKWRRLSQVDLSLSLQQLLLGRRGWVLVSSIVSQRCITA